MYFMKIPGAAVGTLTFALAAMSPLPGVAQGGPVHAVAGPTQYLPMTAGKSGLFKTATAFAKISVADEKIVEITPQSDLEFIINPKAPGSTNVYILDERNALIAAIDVDVAQTSRRPMEAGSEVIIYNRIYDEHGALNKPSRYRCTGIHCETAPDGRGEEAVSGPKAKPTAQLGTVTEVEK